MSKYKTIRTIGHGGFGVVEEIEDKEGNRFARKTFAPSAAIASTFHDRLRKRFRREVITQQELGGTEILPVLDHELSGNKPWFIMPLADKTYHEKINEDKENGLVEIEPIADILNGLQLLHELGYVHRDLNPNNILLNEGTWKLSDLGAILPPSGHTVTLTEDTIIYTERYCAPEQRQDFHNAQSAADIYSLGCILHDLFGSYERTPYAKHTAPGGMGIIIEKCTDPNPSKRPSVNILRTLVLDTFLEEGGHCKLEDAHASKWLEKIEDIDNWNDETYEEFARFFANLDVNERTEGHEYEWIYSISTPFMTRISITAMQKIVERKDGIASAIVEKYCEWARSTQFLFNFSDNICSRLTTIFDYGTPTDKACAFAALVELGESHNRWYIMRCMIRRCKKDNINPEVAKRLAIELKTEEIEYQFRRCVEEIRADPESLVSELAKCCER